MHRRVLGLVCFGAYWLNRIRAGGVRLAHLALLGSAGAVAWGARTITGQSPRHWGGWAGLISGLAAIAVMRWCQRRGFLLFVPVREIAPGEGGQLGVEERLLLRGSGTFAVGERKQHLLEVPISFWRTGMGEHVMAARMAPFQVLGLVGVSGDEAGWWYAFIAADGVHALVEGDLYYGTRRRRGVRVTWAAGEDITETHFTGDDRQLDLLVRELQSSAVKHR